MDLLWPSSLLLFALLPILLVAYLVMLRRRRRFAVRFSSLSLVRAALPQQSRLRRHLPFALLMVALASLMIAAARPVAIVSVPTNQTTIVFAIDASGSMRANDIAPSRLDAAEAAAISFIQSQKSQTQIGIVAFARIAEMVQMPTNDQSALRAAVESLTTGRGTAVGSGILKAIDTLAQVDSSVAPSITDPSIGIAPTPVAKGAYAPGIIVLLTDGVTTTGPDPLEAAQQAVDRGVRVYTISFGTSAENGGFGSLPQGFGGGEQQFGGFRRGVDETVLKQIADMTGGEYYTAESANELQAVFAGLPTYLIVKHETLEMSVIFTALSALFIAMAVVLALRWNPL